MKYLDNQTILQTTFKNKYSTLSNPEGIDLLFQDHLLQRSIIQILQGPSPTISKAIHSMHSLTQESIDH